MQKKLIIPVSMVVIAAGLAYKIKQFENAIAENYTEIPDKIARKAYRNLLKNALLQKYDLDGADDIHIEKIFLMEVEKLS